MQSFPVCDCDISEMKRLLEPSDHPTARDSYALTLRYTQSWPMTHGREKF